jgi:hypothetical protein
MFKKLMVVAMALTFALGFAAAAAAADVKVGGSLRTELTYAWYDAEASPIGDDTFQLDAFHISSSRLKFTYLSDDKKFKGYAELRLRSRSQGNNIDVRHAYFSYSWDGGSILFGQTGGMSDAYFPSQFLDTANSIVGFGKMWFNRLEQIRLTLGQKYKLKLAIEAPSKTGVFVDGDGAVTGLDYRYFPAFAAALDLSFGNVNIYPWVRWEWERVETGSSDVNWHALDFGLDISGDFGLVGFTVGATYGINSAGIGVVGGPAFPVFNADYSERSDHSMFTVFGELRVGGLKIGGGYAAASREDLEGVDLWAGDPYTAAVYANYSIPFGKITFVPEIVWENFGEDTAGANRGNAIKVGLFAMLNF